MPRSRLRPPSDPAVDPANPSPAAAPTTAPSAGSSGSASARASDSGRGPGEPEGALTVLGPLADRLAAFVESFEPARYTGPDAAALVRVFDRIERLAGTGKSLAATRAAEAQVFRRSGHRSAAEWLAAETGESAGEAQGTLNLGAALATQPALNESVRKGRLSKGKARAVSAAGKENPERADDLVKRAESDSFRRVQDRCAEARAEAHSRQSEEQRYEAQRRARLCRTWTDVATGSVCLRARLAPDDGARVTSALRARTDRVFEAARKDGHREAPDAYAADALVALVCGEEGDAEDTPTDPDGQSGRSSRRRSGRRRGDSVHVRIDLEALRAGFAGPGQVCEIPGIGPIPVEVAKKVMGDALCRLVITNGVDVPAICNLKRTIPAAIGAALLERDPVCVVPGCDRRELLEIDHWQTDYAEDGPTEWWNLARLCRHHHRLKTAGTFRLLGGPGRWQWVPAGGGTATPAGGDDPQDGAPDPGPGRTGRAGARGKAPPRSPSDPGPTLFPEDG